MSSSTENTVEPITIKCKDGILVTADKHVIRESKVLTTSLSFDSAPNTEIPVDDINGETMKHVITFCDYFKDEGEYVPVKGYAEREKPTHPAIQFLKTLSEEQLVELTTACNYLDMDRLMDYILVTIIEENIADKEYSEIRKACRMREDYTEEEEEMFRKRHEATPNGQ